MPLSALSAFEFAFYQAIYVSYGSNIVTIKRSERVFSKLVLSACIFDLYELSSEHQCKPLICPRQFERDSLSINSCKQICQIGQMKMGDGGRMGFRANKSV